VPWPELIPRQFLASQERPEVAQVVGVGHQRIGRAAARRQIVQELGDDIHWYAVIVQERDQRLYHARGRVVRGAGLSICPRIRDVLDQRLFTIGRPEHDYGPFNQLLTDRINTRLIVDNWDEVLRLAASIRHGTVSAALIMRKLAAYPRQNQIARALNEIG
jgi:Tn3 transposase DDE domain